MDRIRVHPPALWELTKFAVTAPRYHYATTSETVIQERSNARVSNDSTTASKPRLRETTEKATATTADC